MLRKQEEISRAKAFSSIDDFVPKKAPKPEKPPSSSSGVKKQSKVKNAPIELEDSAELARSKKMLESKAKYYDRMVASGGSLNSDEQCLVMFNQKKQTDRSMPEKYYSSSDNRSSSDEDEPVRNRVLSSTNLDGDW